MIPAGGIVGEPTAVREEDRTASRADAIQRSRAYEHHSRLRRNRAGLTCDHCVSAVTEELCTIGGVSGVDVALNPTGPSQVTVTSDAPLADDQVAAALDEAGDYHVASG